MRMPTVLSWFAFAGLIACSGGGTPAFHPTAASAGSPLSALSDQQVQMLCVEQLQYAHAQETSSAGRDAICRNFGFSAAFQLWSGTNSGAVADTDLRRTCQDAYTTCQTHPPAVGDPGPNPAVCASINVVLSDCSSTVEQYAACETALVGSFL